jgi:hypothetical protein
LVKETNCHERGHRAGDPEGAICNPSEPGHTPAASPADVVEALKTIKANKSMCRTFRVVDEGAADAACSTAGQHDIVNCSYATPL